MRPTRATESSTCFDGRSLRNGHHVQSWSVSAFSARSSLLSSATVVPSPRNAESPLAPGSQRAFLRLTEGSSPQFLSCAGRI